MTLIKIIIYLIERTLTLTQVSSKIELDLIEQI